MCFYLCLNIISMSYRAKHNVIYFSHHTVTAAATIAILTTENIDNKALLLIIIDNNIPDIDAANENHYTHLLCFDIVGLNVVCTSFQTHYLHFPCYCNTHINPYKCFQICSNSCFP